jgi:hypothetical protein
MLPENFVVRSIQHLKQYSNKNSIDFAQNVCMYVCMHVCMYVCIRVGHEAGHCTATFNDLLCFPFRLALY